MSVTVGKLWAICTHPIAGTAKCSPTVARPIGGLNGNVDFVQRVLDIDLDFFVTPLSIGSD